jgi:hypothetical protein
MTSLPPATPSLRSIRFSSSLPALNEAKLLRLGRIKIKITDDGKSFMERLSLMRYLSSERGFNAFAGTKQKDLINTNARLHDNRKMLFWGLAHAFATLVTWSHFFLVKFHKVYEDIPEQVEAIA